MNTLVGLGIHVIDLDLSTTPTVEMAVAMEHADGGIILTASHNPKQWNALKLLNERGEFLDAAAGQEAEARGRGRLPVVTQGQHHGGVPARALGRQHPRARVPDRDPKPAGAPPEEPV